MPDTVAGGSGATSAPPVAAPTTIVGAGAVAAEEAASASGALAVNAAARGRGLGATQAADDTPRSVMTAPTALTEPQRTDRAHTARRKRAADGGAAVAAAPQAAARARVVGPRAGADAATPGDRASSEATVAVPRDARGRGGVREAEEGGDAEPDAVRGEGGGDDGRAANADNDASPGRGEQVSSDESHMELVS